MTSSVVTWISVDDHLPQHPDRVLVARGLKTETARWKRRAKRWVFPSALTSFEPTFWAEMPKGPE